MLYSYQAQEPRSLPSRVRLSDGSTITSLNELSSSELISLGFTGPYTKPSYDEETEKIVWNSNDLQYQIVSLNEQELYQKLQEKISKINYILFWNSLIESSLYNKLRLSASQDLSANTFCTELISLFSDAKNGNPNVSMIQHYLNVIFFIFNFTEQEKLDIYNLFNSFDMLLLYTLPTEEYLNSHQYDPNTNTIIPI